MATLTTVIAWLKANWPNILIVLGALLPILNVISGMAKNHPTSYRWIMHIIAFVSWVRSKDNIDPGALGALKLPFTRERPGGLTKTSASLHMLLPLALLLGGSLLVAAMAGCSGIVWMARPHQLAAPALQADTAAWSDAACQAKQTTVTIEKAVAWALAPAGIVAAVVAAIVSAKVKDPETAALATGITSGALSAGAFIDGLFLDKDSTLLHDNCAAYSVAQFRRMLMQRSSVPGNPQVARRDIGKDGHVAGAVLHPPPQVRIEVGHGGAHQKAGQLSTGSLGETEHAVFVEPKFVVVGHEDRMAIFGRRARAVRP